MARASLDAAPRERPLMVRDAGGRADFAWRSEDQAFHAAISELGVPPARIDAASARSILPPERMTAAFGLLRARLSLARPASARRPRLRPCYACPRAGCGSPPRSRPRRPRRCARRPSDDLDGARIRHPDRDAVREGHRRNSPAPAASPQRTGDRHWRARRRRRRSRSSGRARRACRSARKCRSRGRSAHRRVSMSRWAPKSSSA